MKHNYTSNLILKYLYRETSITETLEIEHAIENDIQLREEYLRIKSGYKGLPKVLFYPTDETMANILDYSSKSAAMDLSF